MALQGPGRLVDQVLQQLQDVGLDAGELGARSRHGSPASSPQCREALQPSSVANQGELDLAPEAHLESPAEGKGIPTLYRPSSSSSISLVVLAVMLVSLSCGSALLTWVGWA